MAQNIPSTTARTHSDLGVYYEKIHNARFASRHYRELYNAVPANEPKMIADAALRFAHSLVESGMVCVVKNSDIALNMNSIL